MPGPYGLPQLPRPIEEAIPERAGKYRVRADCIGATRDAPAVLSLFVNGRLIARAEDNLGFFPRFDGIGLTTWSADGSTGVAYDNVLVRELHKPQGGS